MFLLQVCSNDSNGCYMLFLFLHALCRCFAHCCVHWMQDVFGSQCTKGNICVMFSNIFKHINIYLYIISIMLYFFQFVKLCIDCIVWCPMSGREGGCRWLGSQLAKCSDLCGHASAGVAGRGRQAKHGDAEPSRRLAVGRVAMSHDRSWRSRPPVTMSWLSWVMLLWIWYD